MSLQKLRLSDSSPFRSLELAGSSILSRPIQTTDSNHDPDDFGQEEYDKILPLDAQGYAQNQ